MKKLVLFFAAVVAVSLAACNCCNKEAEEATEEVEATVEAVADSVEAAVEAVADSVEAVAE